MSITAIQTRYKGYHFRSRLEARWAVFLEALGCCWVYEPQGFMLDNEAYLPDFWVSDTAFPRPHLEGTPPEAGLWLEIKPTRLTKGEEKLCHLLARHTRHCVYAAAGNIGANEFLTYKWHYGGGYSLIAEPFDAKWPGNTLLFYLVATTSLWGKINFGECLRKAYRAARSARFEHGEQPSV